MTTYTTSDFEKMAAAMGCEPNEFIKHKTAFETAARWHALDSRRPRRTSPAKMRNKMDQIAKSADRLLKHLGIDRPGDAYDGPGNLEVLAVLAGSAEWSEDAVINATRRIGRLAEILEAVLAARDLGERAQETTDEVIHLGALTVAPDHRGNDAVNNWLAAMMEIYKKVTGNDPATSVGGWRQLNEGIASGPLIRFLQAAAEPVNAAVERAKAAAERVNAAPEPVKIEYGEDALRSRLRTILKWTQRQV